MKKIPYMEINTLPSQLNTSKPTGVVANLASVAEQQKTFDGVTIENMQGNPLYQRMDDIDKVGIAQKKIVDNVSKVKSKTKYIRALNDLAQKKRIPTKK